MMMIVVVSGVIVVNVMSVMSVMSMMGLVAIMSDVVNRVASLVTFSCGASCLCRGQRVMGERLWKPCVVWLMPRSVAHRLKNLR